MTAEISPQLISVRLKSVTAQSGAFCIQSLKRGIVDPDFR